jgi:3,4-dihydroxyphthalate decarboxylase
VIRVGEDARPVGDTHGVSRVNEIYLHTEVYKRRPEINAVIHAHPPGALLCTIAGLKLRPIFGGFEPPGMRMAHEGVPEYERSITLHTLDETIPMLEVMGDKDVILLSRHGTLVTGRSVQDATNRAITFETLCRLNWLANLAGDPGEIMDVDKDEFARRVRVAAEARGRGDGDGEERGGSWNYLMALLDSGAMHFDDLGLGFRF